MSPRTTPRTSRLLTRALVAIAAPAVAVSLAAAPAEAAAAPDVPSIAQTGAVYAHYAGGTVTESPINKITGPGAKCKSTKVYRGARGTSGFYMPADPATQATGATPSVSATAYKFRTAKDAKSFLHPKLPKKCPTTGGGTGGGGNPGEGLGCKAKMKKIKFKLGDERTGYQMRCGSMILQFFTVRDGKHIVMTTATSMDGTAPSAKKSVQFVKVALKAAR